MTRHYRHHPSCDSEATGLRIVADGSGDVTTTEIATTVPS